MASIGNYASALSEAAKKTVTGSISGIGAAIKGAARSEMPGINSAYSFAEALKSSANSRSNKNDKKSTSSQSSSASTSPSSDSSNFNAAVVRELQLINANIIEQTRLLRYQVDSAKTKSQYDEENAREQALRDSKLLDAINNLGSKGGGKGGGGGNEEGPGIGSALASGAAEGIMDRILGGRGGGKGGKDKGDSKDSGKGAGKTRRGGIGGKLLKGAGAVGLGLGAYMAYDRVSNGGESIAGVAKDLAPGAIGATVGGLIGMIGGPIGVAIGSAIGGAIGDSDFGHKMFETILPDLENYGKIFSQKFQEVSASVTKIFDDFVPTFNNIKDTITSSFTTATDYVVSAFSGIRKSVESSFGEVKNWFTNLKFPDLGLGQVTRDPKLAKEVNAEMNAPANQAGNILGNVPNPMGGKAAKQAAMRAGNASAATTSAVPFVTPRPAAVPVENESQAPSTVTGASDRAIDFIKKYEGKFQAKAFRDHKQWSIGYGTKANSIDEVITEEEGFARMKAAVNKSAKSVIDYGKKYGYNWNQNQVDALTSFVYNGGPGFLAQVTDDGKRSNEQISQALLLYNKASKVVQPGLVARREAEKKLFDTSSISTPASGPVKAPQSPGFNSARDSQAAYDAMPTTPVFTGPGFGSYKEGPNPEADTPFSGSKIPESPKPKTSPLTQKMEEVRTEIRKASNATIKVAEKIGKETVNNLKNLTESSARTARAVAPRDKPIRPILKTPEQIIAETNANFAKQFQKTVPKAFSLALRQALFPKGVGVSQQAAGGALFRGQQLNNIFGVGKSVNKLATSLFGKQYGGMFAPALNNLATGYLEAGARAGGRLLFGMIGGMDAEKSNILTGQILGNYARGNKKLAAEQLIYGTTGVATGYETVFSKYGFKNPMEGVNYMANTLGAAVSDPVGRFMDPNAKASEWVDPRTGKKVSLNSTSSFTADAYGRYNVPQSTNANPVGPTWTSGYDKEPTVTPIVGGEKALVIFDPTSKDATKQTNDLLTQQNDQIAADAVRRATDAAEAKYATESSGQGIVGKLQEVITALTEGRVGSGSTAGGSLGIGEGGGGFFGNKGPLAQVGSMAFDLGRVALTQNIVKGLGVKNPYMQMLANFAVNQGLKYAGQAAYSAVFGNATFANAAGQVAGGVSNLLGLGGTQAAAPIIDGTLAAGGSTLLGTAGAATGSSSMAGAAAWSAASQGGAAGATGGTIGAVAPSTATTAAGGSGMLAGLGEAAYALAMNPATWAVVAFIAIASWMMGNDDPPNPTIQRVLYVSGNNDIAKITTNWVFEFDALNQDQKMAWIAISDQLLRIAFNAAKAFEVQAGTLSTYIGAFEYLGTQINKWGVIIGFYNGTPKAPLPQSIDQIDFGTPEAFSKLNANEVARRIVKKVEELYKKGVTHDAKVTEELSKTAEALQKANYKTLGSGLLEATAKRLDTSISKANYNMQPIEASNGYFVEDVGMTGGSPRAVWNEQTGTYVPVSDQPQYVDTGRTDQEGEVLTRPVYEWKTTGIQNIVGYDKQGRPIYDLNSDNKLTAEDFSTNLDTVKAVIPSATATNVGNYIANQSAAAAAAEIAASKPKIDTASGDTTNLVNSGNKITNNNNSTSTTVIRRNDSLDVLRSASAQTAIPIG
jgi:GH24 family phage-related lysozyme (muramidase)